MPSKRKIAEAITAEEDSPDARWSNHTVMELKAELKKRALSKQGVKADLVARLEADDNKLEPFPAPASRAKKAKVMKEITDLDTSGNEKGVVTTPTPNPKKLKKVKEVSPEVEIEGSTAGELIRHQHYQMFDGYREDRLREFVPRPTDDYMKKLKKIQKERMFMLDRAKGVDKYGHECEVFDIAGSTGNIYQTTIGRSPSCLCMDARIRGQKCKHINYALIIILKAPPHLCYQNAFLSEELHSIFANAPITRAPQSEHTHSHDDDTIYTGTRKPIDGECPICVFDMEPGEQIVWCKASCGQNFHKQCFEQWKSSKRGGRVTCVYCRAEWEDDKPRKPVPGSLESLKELAPKVGSYKNIGHLPMYQ